MTDTSLKRHLSRIEGDAPSAAFVGELRERLVHPDSGVQVLTLDDRPAVVPAGRARFTRPLAVAAAIVLGVLVATQLWPSEERSRLASTTEALQVGDRWVDAIVAGDRAAFEALHGPDLEVDDTLMGFSEDTGILTSDVVGDLYYAGFDALQAALAIDDDTITGHPCSDRGAGRVECGFTATMVGTDSYRYTVTAELTVEDDLVRAIDFATSTDPADLRSYVQEFLDAEATPDDRACLAIGFNTVGCGEHESDFLTRYIAYYEAVDD